MNLKNTKTKIFLSFGFLLISLTGSRSCVGLHQVESIYTLITQTSDVPNSDNKITASLLTFETTVTRNEDEIYGVSATGKGFNVNVQNDEAGMDVTLLEGNAELGLKNAGFSCEAGVELVNISGHAVVGDMYVAAKVSTGAAGGIRFEWQKIRGRDCLILNATLVTGVGGELGFGWCKKKKYRK